MRTPAVSILMPTYNGAAHLGEALGSIAGQTARDYELIVVVDGSTDGTERVIERHRADFGDRLRVIRQENRGGGAALNRGLRDARGEFVAILDDDDVWFPRKLETQLTYLRERPECIGCSVVWETSARPGAGVCDPAALCDADGVVQRPIRRHFDHVFWRPSFIMMRREAMRGLAFSPRRDVPYDREFDLAFFGRGPVGIAGREILGRYRVHAGNVSKSPARSFACSLRLRELARQGRFSHFDREQRADFEYFMGRRTRHVVLDQLKLGRRGRACRLLSMEWRAIVRSGSAAFLLASPALLALPTAAVNRCWPSRGVLHEAGSGVRSAAVA